MIGRVVARRAVTRNVTSDGIECYVPTFYHDLKDSSVTTVKVIIKA